MATISKRGSSWFAQIRRKGHKSISKSFPTKGMAQEWARKIEREMDTMDFKDGRGVALVTLGDLIDRYKRELGEIKPFGKNKAAVIESLKRKLGSTRLPDLTTEKLTEHIDARMKEGAGGVTIAIELTYLGSIYRAAKQLWKLPVDSDFIASTRANLPRKRVKTMRTKLKLLSALPLLMLVSACQSIPVSADLPDRPKAPRPEVMDKELPPPLFFQTNLQVIFDKLRPLPTK